MRYDRMDVGVAMKWVCILVIGVGSGVHLHSAVVGLTIAAAVLLWVGVQAEQS